MSLNFKFGPTVGDLVKEVHSIRDKETAEQFFKAYVSYIEDKVKSREWNAVDPVKCAGANIGFCLGERPLNQSGDNISKMWQEVCTLYNWFSV